MRVSKNTLDSVLKRQIQKTFAESVADIRNENEAYQFLSDFLTDNEFESFAKRLAVAYWLKKDRSYANIKTNLKVSSATIAEVSGMMKRKGFELALRKLEAEEWANKWAEKIANTWPKKLKKIFKFA